MQPVLLGSNQPDRPYRGGAGIARLRGTADAGPFSPEDFVGSTTEIFAGGGIGLSALPDGTLLRDAVAADPVAYLGAEHVERFGASTELLVKLLDTGERLFVHFHPDREFALSRLGIDHGKTEAWLVVAAEEGAHAHLGFRREETPEQIARWVQEQDVEGMLSALHRVDLAPGDTLFVPAGMPHSIGPGVTIVELQEPSDLSVLMEYAGFKGLGAESAFLGLDPAVALSSLDRRGRSTAEMAQLKGSLSGRVLPPEADPYFRAEFVSPTGGSAGLDPGFAIVVVVEGSGALRWEGGELRVTRGSTVLVPHAAGALSVDAGLALIRCRPPVG